MKQSRSPAAQTIGEFLFDTLYKQGVRHAFGIPGDFALPTFRFLAESKIKLLTLTHEPSVGFAADAYARMHGLGVACVTYCVGGLNMLNSIACAYAEKSPVLVISGAPSLADRHGDLLVHHKVKTFDTQRKIFEEVTCATAVLDDPETAAEEILRVVEMIKRHSRPGYIEVPYDVVGKIITPATRRFRLPERASDQESLAASVEEAASMLARAKRPVMIVDVEVHRHHLTDQAVALARALNIPIAATLLSKSVIRETNPLYIGVYSGGLSDPACRVYIENSDCVLMLGAFISDVFLGQYTAQLERKNTILVTTDLLRVGVRHYHEVRFADFLKTLAAQSIRAKPAFKNPNPVKAMPAFSSKERAGKLSAESIFRALSIHLQEGDTVISDVGDALFGAISLRTGTRKHFLSNAYYLSMGFAVPASIGAMAAKKDGKICVLVGDGAFQMTGIELSTAAKYGMKPMVIVINNDGYGTQRHIIDGAFNDIHPWKYTKICDLLGYGIAYRADTVEAFEQALKAARSADTMVLIEAVIPRHDCSVPLKALGQALGKARTRKAKASPKRYA